MNMDFPVEQTVKARHSVRTYEDRPLSDKDKEKLNRYIQELSNPFSVPISFHLVETEEAVNAKKLGTYGMIKGAKVFIGAAAAKGGFSLEALGYSFEKLMLYAASLGLGTCWLGGTFHRSGFAAAMDISPSELFPAISPVGYPAGKKRLTESLVRLTAHSDQRKPWDVLFFHKDFQSPLRETDTGAYAFPLAMLRLAPSASNKQPWRVVLTENALHFYEAKTPGYSDRFPYDIQTLDVGIAACHFHLAALEKELAGKFEKLPEPELAAPEHTQYLFSWIPVKP